MSTDRDFNNFSERVNIRQIYEDLGCPQEFKHENVLYTAKLGHFCLKRFPTDHPAKVFTIPDGVTIVDQEAFMDCAGLAMLTFPESVTAVCDDAFSGDIAMTIQIPGDVDFSDFAFDAFENGKLILKRCSTTHAWALIRDLDFEFDDGIEMATEFVPGPYERYTAADEFHVITRYTGSDKVLRIPVEIDLDRFAEVVDDPKMYPDMYGHFHEPYEEYENYIVTYFANGWVHFCTPAYATCVGRHAFAGCQTIEDITLPNTIIEIRTKAFAGCPSLRRVLIPASVTGIAPDAFENCPLLTLEVEKGSYALQYAIENTIDYVIV